MDSSFYQLISKTIKEKDSPHMGVSKYGGTPKWMVKIMENPIEMDDLGIPSFLETPTYPLPFVFWHFPKVLQFLCQLRRHREVQRIGCPSSKHRTRGNHQDHCVGSVPALILGKISSHGFHLWRGGGIIMVENLELWGSPNFRTLACTPKSIKGQKCVGISLFLDPFHQPFLALCTHQDFRKQVYLHFLNPIKPCLLKSEWKQKRYSLPTASSLNFTNSTASLYLFSSWWFQPISKTLFKLGSFPQIGMKILKKKMKPPPSFLLTKKKWGPTTLQTVAPSVKVAPGKPVFGPWEVGVLPFRNLENRPYQGTTSKTLGHV